MKVVKFNFFNYFENPIVEYCNSILEKQLRENITVYTEKDIPPFLKYNNHSKRCYEEKRLSYIGDQLRLYLSLQYDDFLYVDSDVLLSNIDTILKYPNCTEFEKHSNITIINNGTYFHSNKDCDFNKYYYEYYQNNPNTEHSNMMVFKNNPFELSNEYSGDMKLIKTNSHHFLLSTFKLLKKQNLEKIIITNDLNYKTDDVMLYLNSNKNIVYDMKNFYHNCNLLKEQDLANLLKEQINYDNKKTKIEIYLI